MDKYCPDCKTEMAEAFVNTGSAFVLQQKKKGFGAKASSINAYVCPSCGRILFFADTPALFAEDREKL